MGLDIRLPIGLMFTLVGVIMAFYGALTNGDARYADHSLGTNVNLYWGCALAVFGVLMLLGAWRGGVKAAEAKKGSSAEH